LEKTLLSKKIFITGGTSCLGQAFVRYAVLNGADVFFSYFSDQTTAEQLCREGAHKAYHLDLKKTSEFESLSQVLQRDAGYLDGLIHNGAAVRDAALTTMTEEDWDEVMTVDLKAPFFLTQSLLPLLKNHNEAPERKPAKVLFLTSRAAFRGVYGAANYAAAKAGLIGLVKSLAAELGPLPVLVNAVNPGFMISAMTQNLSQTVKESQRKASVLEQFSDPEDVAAFLGYLLSDQTAQATGQVFHWDSRRMNF